jgi:hypothetical protein
MIFYRKKQLRILTTRKIEIYRVFYETANHLIKAYTGSLQFMTCFTLMFKKNANKNLYTVLLPPKKNSIIAVVHQKH